MDTVIDIEALRSKLRAMSRAETRELAIRAGLKPSTIEKFRLSHIEEPRILKLIALKQALEGSQRKRIKQGA